ncbi:C40 family peptidase [Paenibacillus sp. PvR098]|uniref:C40 family peptidase n=1 Tax=unclassified Paenibacillus TaxID=185978 RepID=UPI001B460F38|nr:hypothetical protein [Paenibacillus sp. PvP091]MBP1168941.1 hypothetical protein [Paenibacillus sp. PvR098]MBP2439969.1 hypothetical protein [Paenibacillus sp. PvP052]
MTNNKRFRKLLTGVSLSLAISFSGSMFITPQSTHAAATTSTSAADNVIATGKQLLGVPYQFGAKKGRTDRFDCSSFTQYVFKQNGMDIPRSSRQQANAGTFVPKDQLQPGDLVFSDTNRDGVINHVSIYMGEGKLLHTYRVGVGVTISNFSGSTWDKTYVTARRVIPNNGKAFAAPTSQADMTPVNPVSKSPSLFKPSESSPFKSSNGDNQQGEN